MDATSALDNSVIANLPGVTSTNVRLNTTVQKALGLYTGVDGDFDATIRFNSARAFDFDTRNACATTRPASPRRPVSFRPMDASRPHSRMGERMAARACVLAAKRRRPENLQYSSSET